ncbi:hypothetical protein DDE82_007355 [Stemphylium lycopersici]|uniref:Uncharacterized protein n=1 Tax=Stemphylium lycopersici TaxID=183478 RepID=A0A364MSG3_STELY|nr:hypothetical protein TW65_03953 [Stemphylium lycopersici]RAR00353.1 hypothetical protein DDE82_007355 [Stemphylium lycopersici]RAR01907.1 hypothetical protein DDE83_008755 [Stemphylium lycopersici]
MYRRSDPRWNRTLQHITENLEHANESAQENIYGFTQRYVNPCFSSITQCVNACTAPCFPAHTDRRRHRGRSRGRAESSFDFYDDWEDDENDGLLGWGSDNLDRFLGASANYGATSAQPGRQRAMSYGQRNRDTRYNTPRRKSSTLPRDGAQDPTLIPSSSYFGFLGRLPFKIGGKGLRYKPSAADLTENPGAARRSLEEEQPLIEDSDEDALSRPENKGHRRQRSNTHTSGHTTDSLSSRGDIFPSEDELEDAVPLDDEFTISLERRTTGQWNEDSSTKARSSKSMKRPSASRMSTRTISSRNTSNNSDKPSLPPRSTSETIEEIPTLDDLHKEEERLRLAEEKEVQRKRQEAHFLAVQRGLAPVVSAQEHEAPKDGNTIPALPPSPAPAPLFPAHMATLQSTLPPLVRTPTTLSEQHPHQESMDDDAAVPFPTFVDTQTMPDSSAFYVDESDYSSRRVTPLRPLSRSEQRAGHIEAEEGRRDGDGGGRQGAEGQGDEFVPARLPNFGA